MARSAASSTPTRATTATSRATSIPKGAFRNEHGAQRGSVADMPLFPGDPLTPGVGATQDAKRLPSSEAPTLTKIPVHADLVRATPSRCCARSRGPIGAGGLARRAAPHLSPRPGPGEGPSEARVQLEPGAAYDVIAKLPARSGRTNGSSAATITTPGSTARTIRSAASSPCWRRPGHRRAAQGGLDAEAHDRLRGLGRRRAGPARLHGMGGDARRRAAAARRSSTSTPTATGAASWASAARTPSSASSTRSRATSIDPQTQGQRGRARARASRSSTRHAGGRARRRATGATCASARSAPAPTTRRSSSTSASRRSTSASAARTTAASYHSIYDSFDHYTRFNDPDFEYGVALAQTAARLSCASPRRTCCPSSSPPSPTPRPLRRRRSASSPTTMRDETEEVNRRLRDRTYQLAADPEAGRRAAVAAAARALPQPGAAAEREGEACDESAKAFDAALRRRATAPRVRGVAEARSTRC